MSAVIAAGCGLVVAFGVWLALQALRGNVVLGARSSRRSSSADGSGLQPRPGGVILATGAGHPRSLSFLVAGVIVAVVVIATTRLVVAGAAAGLAVAFVPRIIQARLARQMAIAKMQAASDFVEAIRGSLGAGSGLEAAIVQSAKRPPAALSVELTTFVERAKLPEVTTEQALRQLADDAGEPAIDLLVGSLLAALRGAAGDMGQLFERIADQGRSFAETRAHTQAERAKVEFQTKVLSLLVVGVALLSVVVSPDLTSAYGQSVVGQLRLLIPAVVFWLGWWWLVRLNRVESLYRFKLRGAELS